MSKQEPDLYEQLEKSRQRQASAMKRFEQAQERIARAEERLQALQQRQGASPERQQGHDFTETGAEASMNRNEQKNKASSAPS